ncbi:4'-phosphopantetheinyl transferase family protein [Kitasatospora indigofera]|uniref:4'-phosphopantetheinyl transferase family protein n=1 Tax=Kitasatospora indigofera TaxID=67307 RepID=UPI003633D6DE
MTTPPGKGGPAGGPAGAPADVAVWSVPLSDEPDDRDLAVLDAAERARMRRYVRAADGSRFAAGRAATRRVLGRHLGVPAAAVRIGRRRCPGCGSSRHGPPVVVWPETSLGFSFSGTSVHALVAVAPNGPVGVDIEAVRELDIGGLGGRCLSPAEARHLAGLDPAARARAFLRAWTRKEAVTKAAGVGVATDLRAVHVSPELPGPVEVSFRAGSGPGRWTVTDLVVRPGTVAALARPAGTPTLVDDPSEGHAGRELWHHGERFEPGGGETLLARPAGGWGAVPPPGEKHAR